MTVRSVKVCTAGECNGECYACRLKALITHHNYLVAHIRAMANDAYLCGHPEWQEIVQEANLAVGSIPSRVSIRRAFGFFLIALPPMAALVVVLDLLAFYLDWKVVLIGGGLGLGAFLCLALGIYLVVDDNERNRHAEAAARHPRAGE